VQDCLYQLVENGNENKGEKVFNIALDGQNSEERFTEKRCWRERRITKHPSHTSLIRAGGILRKTAIWKKVTINSAGTEGRVRVETGVMKNQPSGSAYLIDGREGES